MKVTVEYVVQQLINGVWTDRIKRFEKSTALKDRKAVISLRPTAKYSFIKRTTTDQPIKEDNDES